MKRSFALLLVAILSIAALFAQASSETSGSVVAGYPGTELRIQVPFKVGGALDVQARTTAKYLAEELGVNVIVENTVGAGGQLGTTEYLKEKPNTNVILLTDAWLLTVTPLLNEVGYSIDDYVPIIDHNSTLFCLYANPNKTGIKTFEDLVAYSKSHKVLFGSGGAGTSLFIIQKSLLDSFGADSGTITQGGTSEGLVNLIAGTVDISMSSFKDAADYVKNGDIVPILWFGESSYSDENYTSVPCAREKGIDIIYKGFYYYSIRKGTDQGIVQKLHDAFAKVYSNPAFDADRAVIGFNPTSMKGDEISSFLNSFAESAKTTFSL